jgi:hypothetical protein
VSQAPQKKDKLAAMLASATKELKDTTKIGTLFHNRPQVLEEIIKCRKIKLFSYSEIASLLSTEDGVEISAGAVKSWLQKQGVS